MKGKYYNFIDDDTTNNHKRKTFELRQKATNQLKNTDSNRLELEEEESGNYNYLSDSTKREKKNIGYIKDFPKDKINNNRSKSSYHKENELNIRENSNDTKTENLLERNYSISLIKLSFKSRYILIIRIIIFFIMLIYVPLESVSSNTLISFEKVYIINHSIKEFTKELFINPVTGYLSLVIKWIFADRDSIIIFNSCLYMISHPFRIIKVIIVTNIGYYLFVILRLLYKDVRPYWELENNNVLCSFSYANPSLHQFISSFYWTYIVIQYCIGKKESISRLNKIWVLLIIFLINVITGFNLFINYQNYIFQLNYGLVISLMLICIFLDLELNIHNFLLNTMKNIYEIRKNKIQSFLITLFILILSTLLYNLMPIELLNLYVSNILTITNCKYKEINNIGLRSTFNEIAYILGSLGTFWGSALPIEHNCTRWWKSSRKIKAFKIATSLVTSCLILIPFRYFIMTNVDLLFVISCLKYFFVYYVTLGVLPLIFDKLNMNEKDLQKNSEVTKSIFKASMFAIKDKHENTGNLVSPIYKNSVYPFQKHSITHSQENRKLFSSTVLVNKIDPKIKDENLEFLIPSSVIEENK